MSKRILFMTALALVLSCTLALADTVVLKDGRVLQGTYKGGTESAIKVEVDGKIQEIAISEITSLTFSARAPEATTGGGGGAAAVSAPASSSAAAGTIPAGAKLMLKTKDAVTTASHKQGSKFTAVLEADVAVAGKVIVPKGTLVYGTVLESSGGKRVGAQRLLVTFTDLSINNQLVPIVTDDLGAEGARGGAARKVGAAALIGAAAGDAAAGAAVGGALALMGPGGQIQVPAGSMVEVTLKQAVTIP